MGFTACIIAASLRSTAPAPRCGTDEDGFWFKVALGKASRPFPVATLFVHLQFLAPRPPKAPTKTHTLCGGTSKLRGEVWASDARSSTFFGIASLRMSSPLSGLYSFCRTRLPRTRGLPLNELMTIRTWKSPSTLPCPPHPGSWWCMRTAVTASEGGSGQPQQPSYSHTGTFHVYCIPTGATAFDCTSLHVTEQLNTNGQAEALVGDQVKPCSRL